MRKLFTLFLALSLLFLTACNTQPPVVTDSGSSTAPENPGNRQDDLTDQFIYRKSASSSLIELPSRIVFDPITGKIQYTCYYNKADGKAYVYCFDPLCDHSDHTCLANPGSSEINFSLSDSVFAGNRFYCIDCWGKIFSFSFDGSDKRLEYDAQYDLDWEKVNTDLWGVVSLYGQYIYIRSEAEEGLEKPHLLRYHIETKEMEDLTEKTGNFISPDYIYNGKIYGSGNYYETLHTRFIADLDLSTIEVDEDPFYLSCAVGNFAIGSVLGEEVNSLGVHEDIAIEVYNSKTDESWILTAEMLGTDSWAITGMTEEYIYFYEAESIEIGTVIVNQGGKDKEISVKKRNDGKLYRINLDGTNLVCVYDNPDYELNRGMVIFDDKVLMAGQYLKFENGEKKVWGGPIQVATINPDGTIGEFVEVEVLQ